MLIIPAIDLLDAKVVRLKKGDMKDYKIYSDNPVDTAAAFQKMGVKRLHIVDLDGAKKGESVNFDVIQQIIRHTDMEVEVGGGIRTIERAEAYFALGVKYVILGTTAIKDIPLTKKIASAYPGRVILGMDARNGVLSAEGWYEDSKLTVDDLISEYENTPFESVIYTDILRDGMLQGINVEKTRQLAAKSPFGIIASGGLKSEDDVYELQNIDNIKGCIVGKAFYEGLIDIGELLKEEIFNA
ncbi:MAG: 1-(5-phosphoribosyl)-5-[(5-phosphoribosylamino)methylideneamino]imidazole-4-carboxamide isomerase [Flexistipes sinusarabici]|uniref:1-(5-phosphoribosyl)-5-[(5-phosphoribosylamino)methylideneamino] imidazole-4-carboxamide isomerase n=1 Tax=Flexistipes sinusarabici TaxID=2352 RepID=A0A5D0MGW7_FLESI|nr:1-(5-phosphoribosyl)-5-[(5-phosphoribosylamino)methylideneamino]imidazole-4-carboxamide isomerase [Flexistipes sinusarabici]TYB32266.1 MAG: 1-(5-phosphoribosyl)-5-[(5-phosphoribosylamino)methylideneamino]imidazole-4-carboxamide isomerase [Flexistipes sinusarabici]